MDSFKWNLITLFGLVVVVEEWSLLELVVPAHHVAATRVTAQGAVVEVAEWDRLNTGNRLDNI